MRSLGWIKFRYICIYRLFCITNKVILRGSTEYLAKSIIILSSNRSSRKCHVIRWFNTLYRWHTLNQLSRLLLRKAGIHYLMIFVVYHFHCLNVNCMSILNYCNSLYFIIRFLFILFFIFII